MNPPHGSLRFVAEGRAVLEEEWVESLRRRLREQHCRELAVSGVVRRLLLKWSIEREVRRRVRVEMPSKGSLFARQG